MEVGGKGWSTSRDGPSAPLNSWVGEEASQDGASEGDFDRDDRHTGDGTTTNASRLLAVLGPPFARTSRFWWGVFYALVQGVIMGGVGLGFFNLFDWGSTRVWNTLEYKAMVKGGAGAPPLQGDWLWVSWGAGGGLAVGLIKVLWSSLAAHPFPADPPGMIAEINDLKCHDPLLAIPLIILSAISLSVGASVGPEAALGMAGAALGTVMTRRYPLRAIHWLCWKVDACCCRRGGAGGGQAGGGGRGGENGSIDAYNNINDDDDVGGNGGGAGGGDQRGGSDGDRRAPSTAYGDERSNGEYRVREQLHTLTGLAAAFGSLFPNPALSVMMLHELSVASGPLKFPFMESIVYCGIAATTSYCIFFGLESLTFLTPLELPISAYDVIHGKRFRIWYIVAAVPLGLASGIIGLIGVILLGIFKQLGAKVRTGLNGIGEKCRLPPWFLGTLLTPAIGGTMVAYLAMAAPLILGDGNSQLGAIVKAAVLHNTSGATLDVNTVALTGLAKMAALGISLGFGFIGGQIFPLVFAGACAGAVATMVVPGLPLLVAMPCMMVGVPAAFVPSPFAFTMLVSLMLVLGPEATTPVFVSSFTSYACICGVGVIQNLLKRQVKKEQ